MAVRDEHLSSPGVAHGGVLAGLMDADLGAVALLFTAARLVVPLSRKRPSHRT